MSSSDKDRREVPFGSSQLRLPPRQWAVALLVLGAVFALVPSLWERAEKLAPAPNYRMPFSLSNDYWMYGRWSRAACRRKAVLVIGDSVMWGHYVGKDETLPAYLNQLAGAERFANLGVDGVHPAALAGLIEHYGRDVAGRDVILHLNLLWMSSKRHDLRVEKEFSFNHPALVPQFFPRIPCYTEPLAGRLGIVVGRQVTLLAWARHLQMAYFGNADLPAWTLEHPYQNPLAAITLALPSPDEPPSPPPVAEPWTRAHLEKFSPAWVELETSFQWQCFRETVDLLARRGNRVFVLVGPFNEHMLKEKGLEIYHQRLRTVEAWLAEQDIPHCIAALLPSDQYADASHPLADGYAQLARQLMDDPSFAAWVP